MSASRRRRVPSRRVSELVKTAGLRLYLVSEPERTESTTVDGVRGGRRARLRRVPTRHASQLQTQTPKCLRRLAFSTGPTLE